MENATINFIVANGKVYIQDATGLNQASDKVSNTLLKNGKKVYSCSEFCVYKWI